MLGTVGRPQCEQVMIGVLKRAAAPHRDRAAFHVLDGRFSLFSQAEYDRLTAHYAAECRLIAADPPRPIAGAL